MTCVSWEWGEVTWLKVKVDLKFFEMYLNARKPDGVFSRPVKPVSIR